MIYVYDVPEYYNANHIHGFIRRGFNGRVAALADFSGNLYVQSDNKPDVAHMPVKPRAIHELNLPEKTTRVKLTSRVVLDYFKKDDLDEKKRSPIFIPIEEAIEKFSQLTGLTPIRAEAHALGTLETEKFFARCVYLIEGSFSISDREKFNKAASEGVGRRRAYGFGLILIDDFG